MPSSRESGRTQSSQQKQSHRTPLQLRTSSSESDGHHPPTRRASSKLADRRSNVRAPTTEARSASNGIATCQKKRAGGPRTGDMATQLRQAQDEIKKLQDRLSAFEAANNKLEQQFGDQVQLADDQEEVKMQSKSATSPPPPPPPNIDQLNNSDISHDVGSPPVLVDVIRDGAAAEDHQELNSGEEETDVFEVPLTPVIPAPETVEQQVDGDHMKPGEEFPVPEEEEERLQVPPLKLVPGGIAIAAATNEEVLQRHVMELEGKLAAKEEEVEKLVAESESLKKQAAAAAEVDAASARRQEEETEAKMNGMGEELEEMRRKVGESEEALKEETAAKAAMEEEMKRLRVQTEQWRKAADAAAEVLAGDGRRCGSMESKNLFGYAVSGMGGFAHRPLAMDELEEAGKKRGGGIRVLGDLWKKKHPHPH